MPDAEEFDKQKKKKIKEHVHRTMFCDEIDSLPLSSGDMDEQKSSCWEEMSKDCFPPEEKEEMPPKLLPSNSEPFESLPGSIPSYRNGKFLSVLGLPLLTNDMSLSRLDLSYDLFIAAPGLVKGDLSSEFSKRVSRFGICITLRSCWKSIWNVPIEQNSENLLDFRVIVHVVRGKWTPFNSCKEERKYPQRHDSLFFSMFAITRCAERYPDSDH